MEIIKKDASFDGITQSLENTELSFITERNILSNASKAQLKSGNAEPVILAQQIDWSGLTTTIGDTPIIMNTSQDVIGYLAGALEFVYNMTGDIQHTVYSYSGYFSKIIQTAYEIKNIVSDNTTYKLAYIDITYDMIKNYVQNTNSYYSQIIQTAYDITSLVYAYGYAFSMIQQNAYSINTFVSNYDSSYWSKWTQTAYGFEALAYDYKGNSSRWNQTADGFETYVKEYTGDFSRFKQTADMFETHVESYLGDFSTIRQTADRIESIVKSYGESWSTIEQTAYDIKASVKNEVSGYLAQLNISPESIKASIQSEVAHQVSYIEITPDQITQAVENSESIASLKTRADIIEAYVHNVETGYTAAIQVLADQISSKVDSGSDEWSEWIQTKDKIQGTVNGYLGSYSRWTQTADMFETYVQSYTGDFSRFKQTADMFETYVHAYTGYFSKWNQTAYGFDLFVGSYEGILSQLKITGDEISMNVADEVNSYLNKLGITEAGIQAKIENQLGETLSEWNVTKDGIFGTVNGYLGSYSRWNQTATDLTSIITDNSGAWSEWKQNKDSIRAAVNGYNNSYTRWNISADGIEQKVNTAYNTLFTYFIQKTDSILLAANSYTNDKFANVTITADKIKAAVQGDSSFAEQVITDSGIKNTVNGYGGRIGVLETTANEIKLSVKDLENSYKAGFKVLSDSISSTVENILENDYNFDNFATHQDLASYAQKNDLNAYAKIEVLNSYAKKSDIKQTIDEITIGVTGKQFTDSLNSFTTKTKLAEILSSYATSLEVDNKLANLPIGEYVTYTANIVNSYASVDIHGYLNTYVDLYIYKIATANDGEGNIASIEYNINNANVVAYLPPGVLESGTPWFKVNPINDTNEYKAIEQYKNINKEKAKGTLDIQVTIPE